MSHRLRMQRDRQTVVVGVATNGESGHPSRATTRVAPAPARVPAGALDDFQAQQRRQPVEKQSAGGDLVSLAAKIVTEARSIVLFLADPERHQGWPSIVAKLPAEYRKLDELLAAADAARVARGDELHDAKKRGNKAAIANAEKAQNAAVLAWRDAGAEWAKSAASRDTALAELAAAWLAEHGAGFRKLRDDYAAAFPAVRSELAGRADVQGVRYGAFHGSSACHVVQLIADKVAHVLDLDTMRESLEGIDWSALAVAVECEASGLSGARISFKDAANGGPPPEGERWVLISEAAEHLAGGSLGIVRSMVRRKKGPIPKKIIRGKIHVLASAVEQEMRHRETNSHQTTPFRTRKNQ